MNEKKRMGKRWIAGVLAALLTASLAACGKEDSVDIPELLDPIEAADATYTVTRRDLEEITVYEGTVCGDLEVMSLPFSANVDEILARLGDTVKEGDVLVRTEATVDQQILENARQLLLLETSYEQEKERVETEIANLNRLAASYRNAGNRYQARMTELQAEQTELEFSYRNRDTELQLEKLREEQALLQERLAAAEIKAPCSGTITYLKFSSWNTLIEQNEPFLIIQKEMPTRIYVPDMLSYNSYDAVYVEVGDTRYEVTKEDAESSRQLQVTGTYLLPEEAFAGDVEAGAHAAVYAVSAQSKDVLAVPYAAIEKAEVGFYVRRWQDGIWKRTRVEIKEAYIDWIEIIDGISEGDVLYLGKDQAEYGRTYVTTHPYYGSFTYEELLAPASRVAFSQEEFRMPVSGQVEEIFVVTNEEIMVEKGDPLFTIINVKIDQIAWEQLKLDTSNYEAAYQDEKERREEAIEQMEEKLEGKLEATERQLLEYELEKAERELATYIEEQEALLADCNEQLANYETWASGEEVTITAPKAGVISSLIPVYQGAQLENGKRLGDLYDPESFLITYRDDDTSYDRLVPGMRLQYRARNKENVLTDVPAVVFSTNATRPSDDKSEDAYLYLENSDDYVNVYSSGTLVCTRTVENVLLLDLKAIQMGTTDGGGVDQYVLCYDENGSLVRHELTVLAMDSKRGVAWVNGLSEDDTIVYEQRGAEE